MCTNFICINYYIEAVFHSSQIQTITSNNPNCLEKKITPTHDFGILLKVKNGGSFLSYLCVGPLKFSQTCQNLVYIYI